MSKNRMSGKLDLKERVDIQVSLLTAIITLTASLSIFALCYAITYRDTIHMMQDRADAVHEKVVMNLNKATFYQINGEEDTRGISYLKTRAFLSSLRETSNARYIFTAKETEDGKLVYVVDGLMMADEQYRAPGVEIEPELQAYVRTALSGQEVVQKRFTSTQWGNFYWTFYPSMKEDEVVGVISVAFDVQNQFETYRMLLRVVPLVCCICCLAAIFISFHVFRRISNPNFKDVYNTDILTGLKNRNAFEVDINNINASRDFTDRGVLSIDLNNLKKVNDTLGHSAGDSYIQIAANILQENGIPGSVPYRTGGDEFTVLASNVNASQMEDWIKNLKSRMIESRIGEENWSSFAIGYAVFDKKQDDNLIDTYKRADHEMYLDKQMEKEKRHRKS